MRPPVREQDILGDGERLHQLEVLMHHADAVQPCISRTLSDVATVLMMIDPVSGA